jgi:hypothetical protein
MSPEQKTSSETKLRDHRRGVRVNAFVPVALEWQAGERPGDEDRRRAEARTRIVSPYGCLVVLQHELQLEQRVCLTNLANNRSNIGVIVWKGKKRAEGQEFGVELVNPEMGFWGLEL